MKLEMEDTYHKTFMISSINSALNLADETITELLDSITPLVQGRLTHNLLDPLQAQSLINKTQQLADRLSLQVVVDQPVDILKCSVTTFATETSWYALLSIPLVFKSETMTAFQFINIPWFYNGQSVQWNFRDGIVASKSGLYPDIKNVFIPMDDLEQVCEKFNNNYLCHKRINHFPTCQISLLYNHTQECSLKVADPRVRYSFGSLNFLFFQQPTHSLVECPLREAFTTYYHGLISFDDISKCKITTPTFTLLPKSPASSVSPLVKKTIPIFVMENDWIKVTVAFAKGKVQDQANKEPNPWKNDVMIPDQNVDIKIFGSHTVHVHSIAMFVIIILLIIMLAICVMNFLNYTPEYFKSFPITFSSSNPSIIADNDAIPEGEDFTNVQGRPVN